MLKGTCRNRSKDSGASLHVRDPAISQLSRLVVQKAFLLIFTASVHTRCTLHHFWSRNLQRADARHTSSSSNDMTPRHAATL